MPTSIAVLDKTQYVRINTAYNPMVLEAHRDSVRVAVSELQPANNNTAFHKLSGGDAPLSLPSLDTNIWVLAMTSDASLIVTELDPVHVAMHDGFNNPIGSLDGALDNHDADPHHNPYNQFLHFDTEVTTTLNTPASGGENVLDFTSVTAFLEDDEIKLANGGLEPVFFVIKDITGNLVTIDTPITFDHPEGADITLIFTNMAEPGLTASATITNPVVFTSHIPTSAIVHLTNMSVVMTNPGAMDFTKFGGAAELDNGCVLRAKSDGFTGSYTNWKRNLDMDSDAFPIRYQEKSGGGEHGLSASYQIKTNTGAIVYLDGSKVDNFELLAQDSLEGSNTAFRIKLQGHYEGG